jgi:hypothetical protein
MRIWQIAEQTVEDPATRLRFEFSSVHTDTTAAGEEAPGKDDVVVLRLWTSARTHMVTMKFERNGAFISSEVEALAQDIDAGLAGLADKPAVL